MFRVQVVDSHVQGVHRAAGRTTRIPYASLPVLLALSDLLLILATVLLADYVFHTFVSRHNPIGSEAAALGVITGGAATSFIALRGGYTSRGLLSPKRQAILFAQAWAVAFFVVGWLAFLTKTTEGFSRGTVSLSFLAGILVLVVRALMHGAVRRHVARARLAFRTAFVIHIGEGEAGEAMRPELTAQGIEIVGHAYLVSDALRQDRQAHLLCAVDACRTALAARKFEAVYLFAPWSDAGLIDELKALLVRLPVPVFLFTDPHVTRLMQGRMLDTGRMTAFEINRAPLSAFEQAQKRVLDLLLASGLLLLLMPLLALVGMGILVDSGRPILFRQKRKGFGGRPFSIYKFRTMTVCEDGGEIRQAERQDARVTRLGRVLRRTSVDELAQLLNVIRGDMSLVGPRPHAVAHDNYYDRQIATYAYRHHVKPGLTGWAQVNGYRGETREVGQMEARIRHDLWYINNWSIWLDIRIIVTTAWVVLFDKQAY